MNSRIVPGLATAIFTLIVPPANGGEDLVAPEVRANHWAWKTPIRPTVPSVNDAWVRNPIDRFVLAKLQAERLRPARPASREQLIRRVTFDLIGLPPTIAEIDAFVNDRGPDAWEKVVDRLLASPHYGERWGRHWLDLVRYADSNGYEYDEPRPDAWRYRDYVMQSFNDDKPYDRFIKEQLAGDELAPGDPQAAVATGFNLLGPDMTDSSDKAQRRQNTLNDMTDTAGLVFLGVTLGCARCHDHKFEPIPQSDYYRLQAFFTPAKFRLDLPVATASQRPMIEAALQKFNTRLEPLRAELARLEEPYHNRLREARLLKLADEAREAHRLPADRRNARQKELVETTARLLVVKPDELARAISGDDASRRRDLLERIKQAEGEKPVMPVAMGIEDAPGPLPRTFLLTRGELNNPAAEVLPGFPVVLTASHKQENARIDPSAKPSSGRRLALANWIANPENPLTSRVMVNRIWQHHFGRGMVPTPSDFGVRGEAPTHPELLDWLARDFSDHGWQIKRLQRLMLLSATYQQSTMPSAEVLKADPNNRCFSRMNRQRLEGEIIRDSLLAVSGRLNPKMGGRGVFPPIPPEATKGAAAWKTSPDKEDHCRRSIYIFARRNLRFPFLETFDLPDSNLSCPKRERSTTAPQALALLNADDVMEAARALADRIERDAATSSARVAMAYRIALGRRPSPAEEKISAEFLADSSMFEFCRGLLNLNEFIYLD